VSALESTPASDLVLQRIPFEVEAGVCWRVRSGTLAVFAVPRSSDGQPGARRYLFDAQPGCLLVGSEVEGVTHSPRILASPLDPSRLEKSTLATASAQIREGDGELAAALAQWVQNLGLVCAAGKGRGADHEPPEGLCELDSGHVFRPITAGVTWVTVEAGAVLFMGTPGLQLESQAVCAIAPGMSFEAVLPARLNIARGPAHPTSSESALRTTGSLFMRYLSVLEIEDRRKRLARLEDRSRGTEGMTSRALHSLATLGRRTRRVEYLREGSGVVGALRAVGEFLGITIVAPPASDDGNADVLEILRVSRLRGRRVLLEHNWWRSDNGPLLGFLQDDSQPVALIPTSAKQYRLINPSEPGQVIVTPVLAANLQPYAWTVYRALPEGAHSLRDLFRFGLRAQKHDLTVAAALALLTALLNLILPQVSAILFDSVLPDANLQLLGQLGGGLIAAAIGAAVFQIVQTIALQRSESTALHSLQTAVWDRLLRLCPAFFRQYSSGDLLSRSTSIITIEDQIGGQTSFAFFTACASALNLVLMTMYSPLLALIAAGIALVNLLVTVVAGWRIRDLSEDANQTSGVLFGSVVQLVNAVAKLRVACAESRAFAFWASLYAQHQSANRAIRKMEEHLGAWNTLIRLLGPVLIFWPAIAWLDAGKPGGMGLGPLLAFYAAFGALLAATTSFHDRVTDVANALNVWSRLQPILTAAPETSVNKTNPGVLSGHISLSGVSFRYRSDGNLILHDVTINAAAGEAIAIVGPSGSGKSTIINLLLGFEAPLTGSVLYDNQDLAGLDIDAVRRQLGVVIQDTRLTAGTIFENICASGNFTLNEAMQAAQSAGLAVDLAEMPMGIHTVISESASSISGGQRQRILIARALIKQPRILIFDEATSALDNRSQNVVTESLRKLKITRVVVAHRLTTITGVDRIYVLDKGRVVQNGTFEELAAQDGLFQRFIERQRL
jgi:NHLM bacteriocin system ABC transporter ATP-binding protein